MLKANIAFSPIKQHICLQFSMTVSITFCCALSKFGKSKNSFKILTEIEEILILRHFHTKTHESILSKAGIIYTFLILISAFKIL